MLGEIEFVLDPLLVAQAELERAGEEDLAGREREWAQAVAQTLREVQRGLLRHQATVAALGGECVEEQARSRELLWEHAHFLAWARRLLKSIQESRTEPPPPATPADAATVTPSLKSATDWSAIQQQIRDFAEALKHFEEAEATLVLATM